MRHAKRLYHYKLGDCLAESGYIAEAIGELEVAIELSPADGFYHFWLSDLYLMAGRLDDAIREMQQAAMFAPYDDYFNMRLGVLYLLSDHVTDAATAVTQAIKIMPTNAVYHCLLADIYCHRMSCPEMAMRHYAYAGQLDAYDHEHIRRLRELTSLDPNNGVAVDPNDP
jgi:tetratricopeptide (TPR) repeat protein